MSQPEGDKDLNIIKYCCDFMERRIRKREQPPQTQPEIPQALMVEYEVMPQLSVCRLIFGMAQRI